MSPSELHELRRAHRERRADIIGIAAFALAALILIAFRGDPLAFAAVGYGAVVAFVLILFGAGRNCDRMCDAALRDRERKAHQTFPQGDTAHPPYNEQRPAGRPGAA